MMDVHVEVRLFYGSPSTYTWEDAEGVEHLIPQGEGGEKETQ